MRLPALLLWLLGLWVAAGVQAAAGSGTPGPLLLMVVAAGLWLGPAGGMALGTLAGVCDAVVTGWGIIPLGLLGLVTGAIAGLLPRWFSRSHLLVGMLAAGLISLLVSLLLQAGVDQPLKATLMFAVRRGGENALWMFPIYGIVLVMSLRRFQGAP